MVRSFAEIDQLAQRHLTCDYPSKPCDPVEAAIAAGLNDRETAYLIRAIEGYHLPMTRVLVAATAKALRGTDQEAGR